MSSKPIELSFDEGVPFYSSGSFFVTYKGYKLSSQRPDNMMWTINREDGKDVPTVLQGTWTGRDEARRAIDAHGEKLSREDQELNKETTKRTALEKVTAEASSIFNK